MRNLDKTYLFRITHISNVSHILEHGITHKQSAKGNPDYVSIGDTTLIDTRSTKMVLVEDTNDFITLGDFVPFYFAVRTPMLYVIQKGVNFVPQAIAPADIVYLVISMGALKSSGQNFYFSDGHATENFTRFYSNNKVDDLDTILDFKAIGAKYWNEGNDRDLKRKKQAECLIEGDIPAQLISGFAVYNEQAKAELVRMGTDEKSIAVKPNFYF